MKKGRAQIRPRDASTIEVATDLHLILIAIRLSYHQMEFHFQNGKLVKDVRDLRDVSLGLPASLRDIAQLSHKHNSHGSLIS